MFELTDEKKKLIQTDGNLLIVGGPGSGKTTIALLKARNEILKGTLKSGQKILFLSFARTTISRVEEQLSSLNLTAKIKQNIEINTYHGFTWEILKSHGYLLCNLKHLKLLPPPDAASRLVEVVDKETEKKRLFYEEGILHFDLFAELFSTLIKQSGALCRILCNSYPILIFDEFQDTNSHEWEFIQLLGQYSKAIALADAEQRIYEFRGADPQRITDYISVFKPTIFDFGTENNRSNGTDILKFGNDLLSGTVKNNTYNDVECVYYQFFKGNTHLQLKLEVIKSIKRLNKNNNDWSLAILVPTKSLMLNVSDYISCNQQFNDGKKLPAISHEVAVEQAALSLAGVFIAGIMEQGDPDLEMLERLIRHLNEYVRGRKGGDKTGQKDLSLSKSLSQYIDTHKATTNKAVLQECIHLTHGCSNLPFSGNPSEDWLIVREKVKTSQSEILKQLAQDATYLRLLHKGSVLRSGLATLWREKGNYTGAVKLVQDALLQEHFSKTTKIVKGVQLMTIHKAKGKEFDEVIIYEGIKMGKIVRDVNDSKEINKARILLRVAVTRAMKRTTILSPSWEVCPLL